MVVEQTVHTDLYFVHAEVRLHVQGLKSENQ